MAITTTDNGEKIEFFKNVHFAGERIFMDAGSQLIRLKDNQTSALKIENHDGSTQDFLDFKTANSGEQLIFGAPNQFNNTITVGVDDTGYDVKFFGATSGASLLWDESEDDLILAGAARVVVPEGNLVLGSTAVTSTAAELNILDGVTATAAELNILDGVTATTAELNILDGVTATTAEVNVLDGATAGTVVASKALVADSNKDVKGIRDLEVDGDLILGDTAGVDADIFFDYRDGFTSALNIKSGSDRLMRITNGNSSANQIVQTDVKLNIQGGFSIGNTTVSADAADLNMSDVATKGTVEANKVVTTDANKDTTGGRNLTITGELDAATLDISGDADIDGTTNLDAVDIDGDVDLAGDLTFSAAKDIQVVDNNAAALEIAEGSNNYLSIVTTDSSEAVKIEQTLDLDANLDVSTNSHDILIKDNHAAALQFKEGSNNYMTFVTTDGSELVRIAKPLNLLNGIQFDGTAITSTAAELNLLDGATDTTWTATLEGSTGNPGSKVTATGQYVVMGKMVMASVHFNSVDTTSYAGDISISGLPITSKDTATAMFMGHVYNNGMISGATDSVQALVADNGTTISFLENANGSALQWGTVGAGKSMRVQVFYIAA